MSRSSWKYRCHTCGEVLASWAAAERHGDAHHGARIDLVVEVTRPVGRVAPSSPPNDPGGPIPPSGSQRAAGRSTAR